MSNIRSFQDYHPQIADSAYVDSGAVIIGDVVLGEESVFGLGLSLEAIRAK